MVVSRPVPAMASAAPAVVDPTRFQSAVTANDVAALAQDVFGTAFTPESGVTHVAAVWRDAKQRHLVMRIGAETPRSVTDFFVLNLTRAMSGAIIATGKLLRDEPQLDFSLQGPGRLPEGLAAWRRDVAGLSEPPYVVVLTSGRDLDPSHPVWRGWARPLVFTDAEGVARLRGVDVPVVCHPAPSIRAAVDHVRFERGVATVTVEAGPTAARHLYEDPIAVDTVALSVFEGEALPNDLRAGVLFEAGALDRAFAPLGPASRWREASGVWAFARLRRRDLAA